LNRENKRLQYKKGYYRNPMLAMNNLNAKYAGAWLYQKGQPANIGIIARIAFPAFM